MSEAQRRITRAQRLGFIVRLLPLYAALRGADALAPHVGKRWPRRDHSAAFKPGLSVIVAERGTPDLLATTLDALAAACAKVDEAVQIIVVVNGCASADYAGLVAKYTQPSALGASTQFEWQFHADALGYDGAIAAGLAQAKHPWTYLLNSDMRLAPDALVELLPYRQAQVFAITSQIFFEDAQRRREETGWSDFHAHHDTPVVYERTPEPGTLARGNLYPGGGSSLCQTTLLRRYVRDAHEYHPFYWEDADFGVRAWHEGWEVLFCPTSHAWHQHRATVNRFYVQDEIERVIARNAQWFDLRHAWTTIDPGEQIRRIAARDPQHWHEFAGLGRAWRTFRLRLSAHAARARGLPYAKLTVDRYYAPRKLAATARPRVLLVAPFALFPPAHGGARRVAELVTRLSDRVDFILLGDERSLYDLKSEPWLAHLRATHLVEGRGDRAGETPLSLTQRLERHAWPALRNELERLSALYDPQIVQIEFMELALLAPATRAQRRAARARWLLALHDVYLSGDAARDVEQNAAIARFDAVSACSQEDLALLAHPQRALIGNGATDRRGAYAPSPPAPRLLFMGPFRYAQNRAGILEFIDRAWPQLKARFADLRLTILGGVESASVVASEPRLRQAGIEVVSAFVDPAPYLAAASLTINPQTDIRGSSIKLIESLLAGRICVSTADGARGFVDADLRGLVLAADIAAMAAPIAHLLGNDAERGQRERGDDNALDAYTWEAMAAQQLALYQRLLQAN